MAKICTDQSYSTRLRPSNRTTDDDLTVIENGDSRLDLNKTVNRQTVGLNVAAMMDTYE